MFNIGKNKKKDIGTNDNVPQYIEIMPVVAIGGTMNAFTVNDIVMVTPEYIDGETGYTLVGRIDEINRSHDDDYNFTYDHIVLDTSSKFCSDKVRIKIEDIKSIELVEE